MWSCRWERRVNRAEQKEQPNGWLRRTLTKQGAAPLTLADLSPLWIRLCAVRPPAHANVFPKMSQRYAAPGAECLVFSPPVFSQVTRLCERLSTDVTPVWFFSCVDASVHSQVTSCGERLSTDVTSVWSLPCVDASVFSTVQSLFKRLPADVTPVWPLPGVDPFVFSTVTRLFERLLAEATPV